MYEKHQRDYTVVGSGIVMASMLGEKVSGFFGGGLSEIISVVKNGIFYHLQLEGNRQEMSRCFLRRLNNNEIDLEKEYVEFDKMVAEYEKLISKPDQELLLEDILKLFKF